MADNKVTKFLSDLMGPEKIAAWKKFLTDNEIPTVPATQAEPVKFGEGVLKDGTKIKYEGETLTVGSSVMVVAQDGTELPAPDGEHELQDGTKIKVVQGKVAEIVPVTPETPAQPAAQNAVNPTDQLVSALKTLMEGKFEAQSKVIEANQKEIETLKELIAKQSEVIKKNIEFTNEILNLPTGEPIKKPEQKKPEKRNILLNTLKQ